MTFADLTSRSKRKRYSVKGQLRSVSFIWFFVKRKFVLLRERLYVWSLISSRRQLVFKCFSVLVVCSRLVVRPASPSLGKPLEFYSHFPEESREFVWQWVVESAARWLCRANGGVEGTQENRDLLFAATISSAQRELLRRHTEQLVRKKKKTQESFEGNLSRGRDNSRESVVWWRKVVAWRHLQLFWDNNTRGVNWTVIESGVMKVEWKCVGHWKPFDA